MKWTDDIEHETELYLKEFEQTISEEQLHSEFNRIIKLNKQFDRYCKKENITFVGMKKSKKELARRKIFIKWYISKHYVRNVEDCVRELCRILFISESTVYHALYDYR